MELQDPQELMPQVGNTCCVSFGTWSPVLCEPLASIAKRFDTEIVDLKGISYFLACQLIALKKCPGVRPVGIEEKP